MNLAVHPQGLAMNTEHAFSFCEMQMLEHIHAKITVLKTHR